MAATVLTTVTTIIMKHYANDLVKALGLDTPGIIALNSGVSGVILATKEVIKNYSQEMCNSYEQHLTTPPISEDNNTLQ